MAELVKYVGPFSPAEITLPTGGKVTVVSNQVLKLTNNQIEGLLKAQPGWWFTSESLEPEAEPVSEEPTMTITAAFVLGHVAKHVFCNAQTAPFTVGVSQASANKGYEFTLENTATNTNVVTAEALHGEKIRAPNLAAASTMKLGKNEPYASATFVSDGTDWIVQ